MTANAHGTLVNEDAVLVESLGQQRVLVPFGGFSTTPGVDVLGRQRYGPIRTSRLDDYLYLRHC